MDAHSYLSGPRFWIGHFADLQDLLCRAVSLVPCCLHSTLPCGVFSNQPIETSVLGKADISNARPSPLPDQRWNPNEGRGMARPHSLSIMRQNQNEMSAQCTRARLDLPL